MGFDDPARAQLTLDELGFDIGEDQLDPGAPHGSRPGNPRPQAARPGPADAALLESLAAAADPDLALAALARLADRAGEQDAAELRAALRAEPGLRLRLAAVLGASTALGDHLARHPEDWRLVRGPDALRRPSAGELRASLLNAVGAKPYDAEPAVTEPAVTGPAVMGPAVMGPAVTGPAGTGPGDPVTALRVAYRRRLLQLAARDLTGVSPVDEVAAELADLAAAALEAALAIARGQLPAGSAPCRLAVIGMGKCGGRELNYVSDVDVIFVAEPADRDALATATRLASTMMRVCSQSTAEGSLWQVDANLRPEGRSGPLVRTLASHRAYYERWAQTWEFQALLKARPVAGDLELGQAYVETLAPLVWQAAQRENFIADVQAMRRRVLDNVPPGQASRQIKLGPGGLRDIEFAVQLLQLVHGRADESLRSPATLAALAALSDGGYVGREDAADLAAAYRFLRRVEHLLQLQHLRRTHLLPAPGDEPALRRLGRAIGAADGVRARGDPAVRDPAVRDPAVRDPAERFTAQWRRHALQARRLHEKLFYRPLLNAVARLPGDAVRLTPAAAEERLKALGYDDPAHALRHIEALTAGMSRRAAIQRTLLPVMLGWFADAAEPDAGLLAFRQVSDALGETPWYLRLLRDEAGVAERMATVLASSRYATGLLLRAPEAVTLLGDDAELVPRSRDVLRDEALATVRRHGEAEAAVAAVRALRRRELLRISVAGLLGLLGVEETGEALTSVATATVTAALEAATRKIEIELRSPLPTRIAVLAMGRFGGHELGYASDADVMFVHDPLPGGDEAAAARAAHAVVEEMRRLLARPAPDPPLRIDPDLRPEGRQGPLVRTLASYAAYYRRWSAHWEAQALLRAEPVAGDDELGERFRALADELRYPRGGVSPAALREIRRLKARMEAERLPRGADPAIHLKLGPGGLSDVEWVVQLVQLRHAHEVPGLRTTTTLAALSAAAGAGLMDRHDASVLAEAWRMATRIRDAAMLVRGRPGDTLPTGPRQLAAVARILGYPPGDSGRLLDDQRRAARHARTVMERLFYG
jgi:glutamate-ammonia-ligase adenylyltransferase